MERPREPPRATETLVAAALVLLTTTLTLGLFASQFGLYFDDFPSWHLYLTAGTRELVAVAAGQGRPLVGLLPALAGTVAGSHWAMFVVHTLNGLVYLALLRRLWPGFERTAGLAALLFCVYPTYWLRPTHIALAIDGSLLLALLSLWIGLVALDRTGLARAGLTVVSVGLVPAYLLLYELPVGLELVRPALVWLDRRRVGERPGPRRLLSLWAPWLVALVLLAGWRLLLFEPAGDYERLQYNAVAVPVTVAEAARLAGSLLRSLGDQLVGAWWTTTPTGETGSGRLVPWGLAALLTTAGALWCRRASDGDPAGRRHTAGLMALLGCGIAVAGQIAPAATGSAARVHGLGSRWTLVSTLGLSLTWAALAAWPRSRRGRALATGVVLALIGIGAFRHVDNAQQFARDWTAQRRTWWQLAWRVGTPAPGTVIVLDETRRLAQARDRFEYELTLSAELFFGRDGGVVATTSELAARWQVYNPRTFELLGQEWTVDLTRAALLLDGQGCLEVVERGAPLPQGKTLSPQGRQLLRWARPPAIDSQSVESPWRGLFGPEPDDWCRAYQAARREEQRGDDEAIVLIGERAWAAGMEPEVPSEWDVFRAASRRARGRPFPPGATR